MATKQAIIDKMQQRKNDILNNLQSLKEEIQQFDVEHDRTSTKANQQTQIDKTLWIEKENILKDNDNLKIQNQILIQKIQQGETIAAENTILATQLDASRSELAQKSLELLQSNKRNLELESTIIGLKAEISKLLKQGTVMSSGSVSTKKVDNSERIAMINQQQSLISEIEKMKAEYDKYKDLIASIETAAATGKICLVSSRGLKVTTMLELAQEIKNFK